MIKIDFSLPRDVDALATLLGCPPSLLEMCSGPLREILYFKHSIPKRRKSQHRIVYEPVGMLRFIQKNFERKLDAYCREVVGDYPHPSVFGFVRGSSIRRNALPHCGSLELLRVDIRNFFGSIARDRVEEMLRGCGVSNCTIPTISGLLTVHDLVAEGLPTSPLVANLVALPFDRQFAKLAANLGSTYTRYADDLTFSVHSVGGQLPSVEEVERTLNQQGFTLAPEKTRRSKPGQAHFVTGLSVQMPARPTLPKRMRRRMRQELYYIRKYGIRDHANHLNIELKNVVNRIDGRLSYFCGIDRPKWGRAVQSWRDQLMREGLRPSYPAAHFQGVSSALILVDESIVDVNGRSYMSLCAAEVALPGDGALLKDAFAGYLDKIRDELRKLAQHYHLDPYSAGRVDHLPQKGLHFTDDPMDLQTSVVESIAKLPIQIYLGFQQQAGDYQECYVRLLRALLRARLAARRQDTLEIAIEINPQVDRSRICTLIESMYSEVGGGGALSVHTRSKLEEPLLAIADYGAGVFFALRKDQEIHTRRFERLRNRYRYITNLSRGLRFNRRRPLESFADAFEFRETRAAMDQLTPG